MLSQSYLFLKTNFIKKISWSRQENTETNFINIALYQWEKEAKASKQANPLSVES